MPTLKISSVSVSDLRDALSSDGILLKTGPFVSHICSTIPSIADGLALLYADHDLAGASEFADFHVRVAPPPNFRRWINRQVIFEFDGFSAFKPLPFDQAFPMLEWGLNWCISNFAHHSLIIHAAVVEKNGCAAILPAPPGSGKSTLCAGLVNRGWRLLSDELTLVDLRNGTIHPIVRPISLKNKSIEVIQEFAPGAVMSRPIHDTTKGTVAHVKPTAESVARSEDPAHPKWIIFPTFQRNAPTSLNPFSKSRAFMRIADYSFNYSLLGAAGFQSVAKLIDACECYEFSYSVLDEAIETFNKLAIAHG